MVLVQTDHVSQAHTNPVLTLITALHLILFFQHLFYRIAAHNQTPSFKPNTNSMQYNCNKYTWGKCPDWNAVFVFRLNNCELTEKSCSVLATVLSSKTILKEINMNNSRLLDSGVKEICEGLKNPVCELKILKWVHFTSSCTQHHSYTWNIITLSVHLQ